MPETSSFPSARRRNGVRRIGATGYVTFEAKVRVPVPRVGLVQRHRLVQRLASSADIPLVLVAAPGGYGKTTLLTQWAEYDQRPFAWVTVDEADNDPTRFLHYLTLALRSLGPTGEGVPDLVHPSVEDGRALSRLGQTVALMDRSFVLVLDGADLLSNDVCLDVVSRLAEHLPAGSQLAVAARTEPRLPWGTYRAQGRLVSVGRAELDLSIEEGNALLVGAGLGPA